MTTSRTIEWALSLVIVSLISVRSEDQILSINAHTIASSNGDRNIIVNCSTLVETDIDIIWTYFPQWNSLGAPIYTTLNNDSHDTANFSVARYDYISKGVRNMAVELTIKVAKPELAAKYRCTLMDKEASFQLIVLDPVKCPDLDETEYEAGKFVNISCSVNYYSSKEPAEEAPNLAIYRGDSPDPMAADVKINATTVVATTKIALKNEDGGTKFFCGVSYPKGVQINSKNCSVTLPDPCCTNPCQNGGSCSPGDTWDSFTCACVGQWTGTWCTKPTDPCASNPCENGGTCYPRANMKSFTCKCVNQWSGKLCTKQTDPCGSSPCQNGGSCETSDNLDSFTCHCFGGWTGKLCTKPKQDKKMTKN